MSLQDEMAARYREGNLPWDQVEPPPEVVALAPALAPGRALDLGCGYGRASIYLARAGWRVDGVDMVPEAIAEARRRAVAAGVAARIQFHVGLVTDLSFLAAPYDLALDVGCLHSLDAAAATAYGAEVARLLRPNAHYLLFAHLRDESSSEESSRRWITEAAVRRTFAHDFTLARVEHGETQVPDQPAWRSAWFWFRRR